MDPFDDLYARVIVEHALAVRSGQTVLIELASWPSRSRARCIAGCSRRGRTRACRCCPRAGSRPRRSAPPPTCWARPIRSSSSWYERVDCRVTLLALSNVEQLAHVDPARGGGLGDGRPACRCTCWSIATPVARPPGAVRSTRRLRSRRRPGSRSTATATLLGRALKLDQPDPVVAWRAQGELQDRLVERLEAVDELRVVAEGTDLRAARRRSSLDQRLGPPQPPRRRGLHGPARGRDGGRRDVRDAVGLGWPARRGRAPALRGRALRRGSPRAEGDVLDAALDTDEGARTLGEFAFGLNEAIRSPTLDTLLDEKIGGTVHMALGASYAVTGGLNQSALHWDLVCDLRDGGEVYADGAADPARRPFPRRRRLRTVQDRRARGCAGALAARCRLAADRGGGTCATGDGARCARRCLECSAWGRSRLRRRDAATCVRTGGLDGTARSDVRRRRTERSPSRRTGVP